MIQHYHVFGDRWTIAGRPHRWTVIKGKAEWISPYSSLYTLDGQAVPGFYPMRDKARCMRWIYQYERIQKLNERYEEMGGRERFVQRIEAWLLAR